MPRIKHKATFTLAPSTLETLPMLAAGYGVSMSQLLDFLVEEEREQYLELKKQNPRTIPAAAFLLRMKEKGR